MPELNIYSRSRDWRGQILSRFAPTPYVMNGDNGREVRIASSESFYQGIKFHEDDPRQDECFALSGPEAKKFGATAPKDGFVYFGGEPIPFRSTEHRALLKESERQKFLQNPDAFEALVQTKNEGLTLVHRIRGRNVGGDFVEIIHELRDELVMDGKNELICMGGISLATM
ncbi:MAG: hypothetical protein FJY91_03070 [Candidatus Harrisonbacteria bacterium]|nr:hypothetical protein [Candidatus Harrisonbacteria bacterium]